MQFSFTTRIERMEDFQNYHAAPVPNDISEKLLAEKVTRLLATVNGITLRRAIQGPHEGGRFIIFGKTVLKEFRVSPGDTIDLKIESDPNPDFIDVPLELEITLEQDDEARARWEGFTPGKQRSLAYFLSSAKRSDTRIKRAIELAEKIRTFTLHGDKPSSKI